NVASITARVLHIDTKCWRIQPDTVDARGVSRPLPQADFSLVGKTHVASFAANEVMLPSLGGPPPIAQTHDCVGECECSRFLHATPGAGVLEGSLQSFTPIAATDGLDGHHQNLFLHEEE